MKTRVLAAAAVAVLAGSAMGQVLSTGTVSNNGTGGVFLDLTPTGQALNLNAFSTQFANAVGLPTNVEVWTRPGSYVGFTTSNVGWTLSQTVSGTSGGALLNSPDHALTSPIALPAGSTTAVYLVGLTGSAIRYFGTGTTSTANYANADLALFTNVARTGSVAFGGTQFTPRAFVGTLSYSPIPAPGSLALLAFGGLVAGRRRR